MDKRLENIIFKAFNLEKCDLKELTTFRYDHRNNDMRDEKERSLIDLYQFLHLSFDTNKKNLENYKDLYKDEDFIWSFDYVSLLIKSQGNNIENERCSLGTKNRLPFQPALWK